MEQDYKAGSSSILILIIAIAVAVIVNIAILVWVGWFHRNWQTKRLCQALSYLGIDSIVEGFS